MILKSENKLKLINKAINTVISRKDGKEYNLQTLYLQDNDGAVTSVVVNKMIYDKATINELYKIKVLFDYNGKLTLNDIEK